MRISDWSSDVCSSDLVTTPPTVSSFKGSGLYQPRLGLEMEMVVADAATGASLPVRAYFDALLDIKRARGQACEPHFLEDRCVSVQTPLAECGQIGRAS